MGRHLGAAAALWLASGFSARLASPRRAARNGYRWFAVAAACVAVGAIVQQAFGGLAGGAQPLRLADLISLAALPALVIGLATLTARLGAADDGVLAEAGRRAQGGIARGIVVDSCLLVSALFVVLLVSLFGPDYVPAEIGRAAFALALVRPVADLIALGMVLRFVVRSIRLTVFPVLALLAITAGRLAGCRGPRCRARTRPRLAASRGAGAGAARARAAAQRPS